jgi:hypothetical protein
MYEERIDRESADEILEKLSQESQKEKKQEEQTIKKRAEEEKNIPLWQQLIFGTKKKQ